MEDIVLSDSVVMTSSIAKPFQMHTIVSIVLVLLAIITIIIATKKHYIKGVIASIIGLVISHMIYNTGVNMLNYVEVLADGSGNNDNIIIGTILFVISIIIQLIPFIICLKNNKKVKKDEVKQ